MMEIPILHILMFIAMTLCPERMDTISLKRAEGTITLTRQDGKWQSADARGLWSKQGTLVTMSLGEASPQTRDVSRFVGEAIAKFDWDNGGAYSNNLLAVRKTDGGFKVTFGPEGTADKTCLITFGNGGQEPSGPSVKSLPPSVVSTIPQCGDTAVDPALKEIRVTFSKDMITEKMWSICQVSKDSFPESAGEIRYLADKRTCVFPVKLQAGKTYVLWFNRGQFDAFRDTANQPAVPYQLVFETRK